MNKQGFILGLDQLLPSSEEQESIPGTAWAGKVPAAGCSSCVLSYPPSASLLGVCCHIPALWLYQALPSPSRAQSSCRGWESWSWGYSLLDVQHCHWFLWRPWRKRGPALCHCFAACVIHITAPSSPGNERGITN